jgi:hypothetical protein
MAKGGLTKGKSHAEGGIKMKVKSTGQNIEVEGGEVIINKKNVADPTKLDFEGEQKTTCEILSDLNSRNDNGVTLECDSVEGKKYKHKEGGKLPKDNTRLIIEVDYGSYTENIVVDKNNVEEVANYLMNDLSIYEATYVSGDKDFFYGYIKPKKTNRIQKIIDWENQALRLEEEASYGTNWQKREILEKKAKLINEKAERGLSKINANELVYYCQYYMTADLIEFRDEYFADSRLGKIRFQPEKKEKEYKEGGKLPKGTYRYKSKGVNYIVRKLDDEYGKRWLAWQTDDSSDWNDDKILDYKGKTKADLIRFIDNLDRIYKQQTPKSDLPKPFELTYNRLKAKSEGKGRMPSLKKIAELLDELKIPNFYSDVETEKYSKSSGMRYSTSGGARTYKGGNLEVKEIRLDINSTDSYYAYNTTDYAKKLIDLIDEKLSEIKPKQTPKSDLEKALKGIEVAIEISGETKDLLKAKEGIEMAMELSNKPKDERIVKNNNSDKLKVGDTLGTWTVKKIVKARFREFSIPKDRMVNVVYEVALISNSKGQERVLRTKFKGANQSEQSMSSWNQKRSYIKWNELDII